jgi:hypothetical protein
MNWRQPIIAVNTSPNPHRQTKLTQGLEKLKQTAPEDTAGMGMALSDLHDALEDFIRWQLAQNAPHLRSAAEDPRTSWQDLLRYSQAHLGFTENDRNMITEAEAQQNAFKRGRGFTYSYSDLVNYAQFVQKWVKGDQSGQSAQDLWLGQGQSHGSAAQEPVPEWDDRDFLLQPQPKPWYRSTLMLFLLFFLFPPLWAMLILTDPRQNSILRGLAALEITIIFFIFAYFFLPMRSSHRNAINYLWQTITGVTTPTQVLDTIPTVPPVFASPPSVEAGSVPSASTDVSTGAPSACSVIWVEEPGDALAALAGKTRAMAWAEVIQAKVEGSGMTSSQFYDLVVERNPHLAADGYVFQAGKTYSLPGCAE